MHQPTIQRAHRILLEVALTITNSPLPVSRDRDLVRLNAQVALITNALAARHIAETAGDADTLRMQRHLLNFSNPHMQAMDYQTWSALLYQKQDTQPTSSCSSSLTNDGYIYHNCTFDDKPLPCINCPVLLELMPSITSGIPRITVPEPPEQDHNLHASAAAVHQAFNLLNQWTAVMAHHQPLGPQAVAAALACFNTTYYLEAAIERHVQDHLDPAPPDTQPLLKRSNKFAERIYRLIGGPPGPVTLVNGHSKLTSCTQEMEHTTFARYFCSGPGLPVDADYNEEPTSPCSKCPMHPGTMNPANIKPRPWQLLQRAIQDRSASPLPGDH